MFLRLFALFAAVPLLELYLLVEVGSRIGALATILLVILTALIGAALARQQGLQTIARIQQHLERGEVPTQELLDGVMILAAAAVLLTPGLITDALGFALLIPATRSRLRRHLAERFKDRVRTRTIDIDMRR